VFDEAQASAVESESNLEEDEDFHQFATHRKKWMEHYKEVYNQNIADLEDKKELVH
jgi:hypothetical protein